MTNWIILGLGNPGEKFENTRHNISWRVLDILSNKLAGYKKYEKKEPYHCQECSKVWQVHSDITLTKSHDKLVPEYTLIGNRILLQFFTLDYIHLWLDNRFCG